MVTVRAFLRGGYRTYTGPVDVMAGLELVGTWLPAGTAAETAPPVRAPGDLSTTPGVSRFSGQSAVADPLGKRRAASAAQADLLGKINKGGKA